MKLNCGCPKTLPEGMKYDPDTSMHELKRVWSKHMAIGIK